MGCLYHPSDSTPCLSISPWRLTHLKVTTEAEVAFFEPLDFSQLHCSNLTSLVIKQVTFHSPPVPLQVLRWSKPAGKFHPSSLHFGETCPQELHSLLCARWGSSVLIHDIRWIARRLAYLVELSIEFEPSIGPLRSERRNGIHRILGAGTTGGRKLDLGILQA
jgi:hypothetical protein